MQEARSEEDFSERFPWKENIAKSVADFTGPRLVFEDGFETTEITETEKHGKLVGWRIGSDLVVSFYWYSHDGISDGYEVGLVVYANFRPIKDSEEKVLKKNISALNDLREKVGLRPIKL